MTLNRKLPQYIVGLGVMMMMIQVGIASGWTSPYLAKLTAPDSPLPLTLYEASWVASLVMVGRFVGAVVGAIGANFMGSKKSLLLILTSILICWILKFFATSPAWLYVARSFAGLALGVMYSTFSVYLGEVTLPEIRGALVTLACFGATSGLVLGNFIGSYLPMKTLSVINQVPCLVLILLFIWLPESPHHLVKVNELEKAKESIKWYRSNCGVEEELEFITRFVTSTKSQKFVDKLKDFGKPVVMRAMALVLFGWLIMQTSGYNMLQAYTELILINGKVTFIEPKIAVLLINSMGALSTLGTVFLMDKSGRRMLVIISGMGTTAALAGIGIHFMLIETEYDSSDFQWLLVTSFVLYQIFVFPGVMCVPTVLVGELFPANVKYYAACLASTMGGIFSFVDLKSYQPLVDLISESNVFFLHAALTFTVVPYAIIFLPETKGKTLQQIQDELVKNKDKQTL